MCATHVNPKTMYDSLAFGFSHGALSEGDHPLFLLQKFDLRGKPAELDSLNP